MKHIIMLILVLLIFSSCTTFDEFKYIYNTSKKISNDSINSILNYDNDEIFNHVVEFNYFYNGCFYDENEGMNLSSDKTKLYDYQNLKLDYNENFSTEYGFPAFYVGYFQTFNEAIYFAETNLDEVNNYIFSHSSETIDYNQIEYDYRIDQICNPEYLGYLVSFNTLDTYISEHNFSVNTTNKMTTQEYLQLLISNDKVLNSLGTFVVYEVYLGNIPYMHFNIPN